MRTGGKSYLDGWEVPMESPTSRQIRPLLHRHSVNATRNHFVNSPTYAKQVVVVVAAAAYVEFMGVTATYWYFLFALPYML